MKQDLIRYCLLIYSDGIITLETQSPKRFFRQHVSVILFEESYFGFNRRINKKLNAIILCLFFGKLCDLGT
jgi:hypothetical protein